MKTEPIVIGESVAFKSEILEQERPVYIALPDGYHTNEAQSARFPVVFVMDGEANFRLFSGLIQLQAAAGTILPMIVVALPNVDRDNDFDPKTGAIEKFLEFMEKELIPFIDSQYRTFPYRLLYGHSYLGLFAIRALLGAPHLFEAYIASSPSLRWNPELLTQTPLFNGSGAEPLKKFCFITAADNDLDGLGKMAEDFVTHLGREAPEGLAYKLKVMENENHDTNAFRSFSEGLMAVSQWYLESRRQEIPMDNPDK